MKSNLIFIMCLLLGFISCKKTTNDLSANNTSVSSNVLSQIAAQGYSTDNVVKSKGGYLVEGDIFLSDQSLSGGASSTTLRIAETEQYQSTYILSKPKTITISLDGTFANQLSPLLAKEYQNAIATTVTRYNALNLGITLAPGGGKGLGVFTIDNTSPDMAGNYAVGPGFPTSTGGFPVGPIRVNTNLIGPSPTQGFLNWIVAHEVGHCIGFRHTDILNSTPSCGYKRNESISPNGAILIPGTPSTDASSWMVTCLDPSRDNPFDANDIIALRYLYTICNPPADTITGIKFNITADTLSWNALAGATGYIVKVTACPPLINPSPVGYTVTTSTNFIGNYFPFPGYSPKYGTYSLTITPTNSCGSGIPSSFTGTIGIAP